MSKNWKHETWRNWFFSCNLSNKTYSKSRTLFLSHPTHSVYRISKRFCASKFWWKFAVLQLSPLTSPVSSKHYSVFLIIRVHDHCETVRWHYTIILYTDRTRVDVSETFNADPLWFSIFSGLFQCCSLCERLWTALIQFWTALKTKNFRAKNQRWNIAEHRLFPLKQRWTTSFLRHINQFFRISCSIFLRSKNGTKPRKIWFYVSALATKLIWFSFSKAFSRLVGWVSENNF